MVLHHRHEMVDMRNAYESDRSYPPAELDSGRPHQNSRSCSSSDKAYEAQPAEPSPSKRREKPKLVHHDTCEGRIEYMPGHFFDDRQTTSSPRASVASIETYASTEAEVEEYQGEVPDYEIPEYTASQDQDGPLPATPSDFSQLFPSSRRLNIRHDDSTLDGNMNLRVDTQVSVNGRRCDMTLFHLRMHDLKTREFSLRRYCRDSGREVCHSVRKSATPAKEKRPGFQRSLSNALNSIRQKSDSSTPTAASLKRHDSGYGSMHSVDSEQQDRPASEGREAGSAAKNSQTNNMKLEFSNYAQVDVRRRAMTGNKKYEFEYWGTTYAWRRVVRNRDNFKETSYHLTKTGSDEALVYIIPVPLTTEQAREEHSKGGWIPPCSFWIADQSIVHAQKDVSDVIIASGLMALVDDTIRMRFHSKGARQMLIPLPKVDFGMEYIGPKRLINEMFGKHGSSHSAPATRPSSSGRPSTSGLSSKAPATTLKQISREQTF